MLYINPHIPSIPPEEVEGMMPSIPAWRREAAMEFKFPEGRKECVMAYLELCRGLRLEYGIQDMPNFAYGPHGKPYLPKYPDIHFNLSHCRQAVGCIIGNRPCGLDIERVRTQNTELTNYVMNMEEREKILHSPDPEIEFTRLWTQKEAVLKLHGTGITDNLQDTLCHLDGIELHTEVAPDKSYVLSWAIINESPDIRGTFQSDVTKKNS